jgi:ATP/maltotriose-dependent transcriptional regulator MalT
VLGREDPSTAGEVDLARRIQRMLVGLARHVATLNGHCLSTHRVEVASQIGLTVREIAVLGLVGQGLTAAAVGRRLLIAEGTARKHLEHVYSKLGVSDRLSAVLRARELALIPPQAH